MSNRNVKHENVDVDEAKDIKIDNTSLLIKIIMKIHDILYIKRIINQRMITEYLMTIKQYQSQFIGDYDSENYDYGYNIDDDYFNGFN
ncbi:hypothetical protein ENUP19_0059G0015 [Entamoeba nuttalli]|uniref:Uncharacterized protein n=1 Tax=Entamoeba nuttalli TaxID=412467 RepID=A0ABQ0DD84_9EUKA